MDPVGTLRDIVNNSLIYAWDGTVYLLPALPKARPKGSISDILARGQLKIENMSWDIPAGHIELVLRSAIHQTVTLHLPRELDFSSAGVTGDASLEKVADSGNLRKLNLNKDNHMKHKLNFRKSH